MSRWCAWTSPISYAGFCLEKNNRVLFGVFMLLLIIGTPVAFCLGIASLATILYMQLPPIVVFQQLNSGMNAFAMMAIPFFIYAGDLMMRGGIADRLIRLAAGL